MTRTDPDPQAMRSAPTRFVAFGTYPNEMQAGIVRAVLEEAGIRAFVQPSDAMPGSVGIFGTLSLVPSSVMVAPDDLTRAAAALEEASIDLSPEELEAAAMADSEGEAGHIKAETDEGGTARTGSRQVFQKKRSLMRVVGWTIVILVLLWVLAAMIGTVVFMIQEMFFSGDDGPRAYAL